MSDDLYFLIEGGKALELVKSHIQDREAVDDRNRELIKPLDVDKFYVHIMDGTVCGVEFNGKVHPDFTKPDRRGLSHPKKKTEWAAKFKDQKGYDKGCWGLVKAFGIPTSISYKGKDTVYGSGSISYRFGSGCGFLYLGEDGPYAMYMPDVSKAVARYEADGYTVDDESKNFKLEFDGARPILKEEWELLVAQRDLELARAKAA